MTSLMLIGSFALTALVYAAAGFGGGSTYTALLSFTGLDYRALPMVSLACNIAVTAGGAWTFWRAGHVRIGDVAPFLVGAIPAAYGGGMVAVPAHVFFALLGLALAFAGVQMMLGGGAPPATTNNATAGYGDTPPPAQRVGNVSNGLPRHSRLVALGPELGAVLEAVLRAALGVTLGAGIGFMASLVGIGGGIFLCPVLHALRHGPPRMIAGMCSLFIFASSLAGLTGRLSAPGAETAMLEALGLWVLLPVVVIFGLAGSRLSAYVIAPAMIKRFTGVLVLLAAVRLLWRAGSLMQEHGGLGL